MSLADRAQYYRRIFSAYLLKQESQLTFWHEVPQINPQAFTGELGQYFMLFSEKADYAGVHDASGIPMLDYRGRIGQQYNPIAIAQWGLGNCNLFMRDRFMRDRDNARRRKFLAASDWLVAHLQQNRSGVWVWNHHFDWEYRTTLKAPWYSGLAQGQGISLLVRAYRETNLPAYRDAAERAFQSFLKSTSDGGVVFTDEQGSVWLEEYIVSPPTHILNGFMWAAWGIHDFFVANGDPSAKDLFARCVQTLRLNLARYDLGFWSLYEQAGTRLPMIASAFYHQLHIVQLRVMHRLADDEFFARVAEKWADYTRHRSYRTRALCYKCAFKLCYY